MKNAPTPEADRYTVVRCGQKWSRLNEMSAIWRKRKLERAYGKGTSPETRVSIYRESDDTRMYAVPCDAGSLRDEKLITDEQYEARMDEMSQGD